MEGPTSKKTKESPKKVNHTRNIKFPNPVPLQEVYQRRKGRHKRILTTKEDVPQVPKPPPLARSISKKERETQEDLNNQRRHVQNW